ncbi:Cul5 protein [Aphelenchoides avenae]|nr:Cul5 protein [Aphelenchus avenae]
MSEIVLELAYLPDTGQAHKSRTTQALEANGILRYVSGGSCKAATVPTRPDTVERLVDKYVNVLVIEYQEQLLNDGPAFTKNRETKTKYALRPRQQGPGRHPDDVIERSVSEKYVDQLLTTYRSLSNLVQDAHRNDGQKNDRLHPRTKLNPLGRLQMNP